MYLHELALELHMTVGEMCSRMSLHELTVMWPAFFHQRAVIEERKQQSQS